MEKLGGLERVRRKRRKEEESGGGCGSLTPLPWLIQ